MHRCNPFVARFSISNDYGFSENVCFSSKTTAMKEWNYLRSSVDVYVLNQSESMGTRLVSQLSFRLSTLSSLALSLPLKQQFYIRVLKQIRETVIIQRRRRNPNRFALLVTNYGRRHTVTSSFKNGCFYPTISTENRMFCKSGDNTIKCESQRVQKKYYPKTIKRLWNCSTGYHKVSKLCLSLAADEGR